MTALNYPLNSTLRCCSSLWSLISLGCSCYCLKTFLEYPHVLRNYDLLPAYPLPRITTFAIILISLYPSANFAPRNDQVRPMLYTFAHLN